jgi:hypothetical protein
MTCASVVTNPSSRELIDEICKWARDRLVSLIHFSAATALIATSFPGR